MSLSMSDDAVIAFLNHLAAPKEGAGRRPLPQTDPFEGYDPASDPVLQPATPAQLRTGMATGTAVGYDDSKNTTGQIMAVARDEADAKRSKPVVDAEKLYQDHVRLSQIQILKPATYTMACALANVESGWRIEALDEPTTAKIMAALDSLLSVDEKRAGIAAANENYRVV
jgi:hypothetical protein